MIFTPILRPLFVPKSVKRQVRLMYHVFLDEITKNSERNSRRIIFPTSTNVTALTRCDGRCGSMPLLIHLSQSRAQRCELFIIRDELCETENLCRGNAEVCTNCYGIIHASLSKIIHSSFHSNFFLKSVLRYKLRYISNVPLFTNH